MFTTIYLNLLGVGNREAVWDAMAFFVMVMTMLVLLVYLARKKEVK